MTFFGKAHKSYKLLATTLTNKKYNVFLLTSIAFSWVLISYSVYYTVNVEPLSKGILGTQVASAKEALLTPVVEVTINATSTPTPLPPTNTPVPTPTTVAKKTPTRTPTVSEPLPTNDPKYTAQKIGDTTWRVENVTNDSAMASAQDVVNALNSYRGEHGKANLTVDTALSSLAQERANLFATNGSLDSHVGFRSYMDNGGFDKSGFNSLGENSAMLSGPMNGDKIVRQIFGADSAHDGNQLDNWTHIGVGVNGNAINVNFGKNKR